MQRNVINRKMHELEMTQSELAERIGVTRGMVSLIILGKSGISVDLLKRLCKALNVRPEEIW